MSNADVITLPQFLAKVPRIIGHLPGTIKGLKLQNITNKSEPVGIGLEIQKRASERPNSLAVLYQDTQLTYAQFNAWTNRIADYLLSIGLKKGDVAAIDIENRPELLAVVVACAKIGVCNALLNTSQRGTVLTHSINLVKPKLIVVGEEMVEAVEEIREYLDAPAEAFHFLADRDTLEDAGAAPAGYKNLAELIRDCSSENPDTVNRVFIDDPLFYIYTSGTTGLPKAVVFNHGRWMKAYGGFGYGAVRLTHTDRIYCTLPFYHATGMVICWGSAIAGGAALILARKFSASKFWDDIRRYRATSFGYVGELCRYLFEQPAKPNDRDNQVRIIVGNGLRPGIWIPFKERFGIEEVLELYASSEGNVAFTNVFNFDNTVGFSPVPYAIVKYDKEKEEPIRGKNGFMVKVSKGESGLLIGEITDKTPFHGYTDKEKTEKVILRNVFKKGDAWFNTGDMMRDIGFRHAQFVDRLGDTFRWKGENVSTTEVEYIMDGFEGMQESVVYGVEIPNTNGRAGMACIRIEGEPEQFDFAGLYDYLKQQLPPYAIPLFLRINRQAMTTTGTFKHQKNHLKEEKYDLSKQDSEIFVLLPGSDTYVRLTPELQQDIDNGKYRM